MHNAHFKENYLVDKPIKNLMSNQNTVKRSTINIPTKIYGLILSLSANQISFSSTVVMLLTEALEARGLIVDKIEPITKDELKEKP
ncbi:hypothetical protein DSM106972_056500 [Dulcicalothrix desertica PCC 7102]|uniref:Uncharacterized protein n=2 Tax=Dulcicalothrix desertica TaxID=32056 RepID=A0A3S1B0Y8_9CYAN|nr:hypothetical protein DSM106972_056500 [Dulcicalothrix desertica PCC 7102]TWH39035.1 hypothetical protein CAL7102_08239 [Dulcicalothrix desertica PCC 7102]